MGRKYRLAERQGRPKPSELADRLRAERERLGMSAEDAGRKLGISPGAYRLAETTTHLQYGAILAYVDMLGYDPRNLVPELVRAIHDADSREGR